jgi:DNA-binding XRE family transcriptional regulator
LEGVSKMVNETKKYKKLRKDQIPPIPGKERELDKKEKSEEVEIPGYTIAELRQQIMGDILEQVDEKLEKLIDSIKALGYDDILDKEDLRVYEKSKSYKNKKPVLSPLVIEPGKGYKVVNNLREVIFNSSYNQREIANIVGITNQTLSNIVNNKFSTSLEVAMKLCVVLGISLEDHFWLEEVDE